MAATQWAYTGFHPNAGLEGVAATVLSCRLLMRERPDILLPSHGEPVVDPEGAVTRLTSLLRELLDSRRRTPWDPDAMLEQPWQHVTPTSPAQHHERRPVLCPALGPGCRAPAGLRLRPHHRAARRARPLVTAPPAGVRGGAAPPARRGPGRGGVAHALSRRPRRRVQPAAGGPRNRGLVAGAHRRGPGRTLRLGPALSVVRADPRGPRASQAGVVPLARVRDRCPRPPRPHAVRRRLLHDRRRTSCRGEPATSRTPRGIRSVASPRSSTTSTATASGSTTSHGAPHCTGGCGRR